MGLTVGIDSRRLELPGESIVIGRSSAAPLCLPDARLDEQHAVLRLVAGRWLIEALGNAVIRVGDGRPTKVAWLVPNDVIQLTETGPSITFSPTAAPTGEVEVVSLPKAKPAPAPTVPLGPTIPPMAPLPRLSSPPSKATGLPLKLQIAGIAAVLVLGLIVLISRLQTPATTPGTILATSPAPSMHQPLPAIAPGALERSAAPRSSPSPPSQNPPAETASTASQLAAAVYLVMISAPEQDQTFCLGTAWAVDKRRLITSGSIGQAIQENREELPKSHVQSINAAPKFEVKDVVLHPMFRRLRSESMALEAEYDELLAAFEDSQDEAAADELKPKIIAIQDRMFDTQHQMVDCDFAVLAVDQDLPATIPSSAEDAPKARPGSTVQMIGLPFPANDRLVDPHLALAATMHSGQVKVRVPATGSEVRRWLIRFANVSAGENWTGSPVVNSAGQAVGIYTRPMPVGTADAGETEAHEITALAPLAAILEPPP